MDLQMAVKNEIKYAPIGELMLDPLNPRLGRANTRPDLPQSKILDLMKDWSLEGLALSFVESGFWPQEAVLVVKERLYGKPALVVVEGNRRLAALRYLKDAVEGNRVDRKWREILNHKAPPKELFDRIPYIEIDSRKDIESS